jgi:hypothetical protein
MCDRLFRLQADRSLEGAQRFAHLSLQGALSPHDTKFHL